MFQCSQTWLLDSLISAKGQLFGVYTSAWPPLLLSVAFLQEERPGREAPLQTTTLPTGSNRRRLSMMAGGSRGSPKTGGSYRPYDRKPEALVPVAPDSSTSRILCGTSSEPRERGLRLQYVGLGSAFGSSPVLREPGSHGDLGPKKARSRLQGP